MEEDKFFVDEAAKLSDKKILIIGAGRHKLTDILEYINMCNFDVAPKAEMIGEPYVFTGMFKVPDTGRDFLQKLSEENIGIILIDGAIQVNVNDELSLLDRIKEIKPTFDKTFAEINDSYKEAVGCYGGEFNIHLPIDEFRKIKETFERQTASIEECTYIFENLRMQLDIIDDVLIPYKYQERICTNTIRTNYKPPHRKPPFTRRGNRQSYKPSG